MIGYDIDSVRSHETLGRRTFITVAASAATGVGAFSGTASTARVNTYSSVYTTSDLSVRTGPGTGYSRKAVADQYTGGYVVGGPQNADGYTWWKVRYNEDDTSGAVVGWFAGDWLVHADFSYPATGTVTATFYDSRSFGYHSAVDIANDRGINILATRGGTVNTVGWDDDGYRNDIIIDHGSGLQTLYGHCTTCFSRKARASTGINTSATWVVRATRPGRMFTTKFGVMAPGSTSHRTRTRETITTTLALVFRRSISESGIRGGISKGSPLPDVDFAQ
jgi:hypothetical protein